MNRTHLIALALPLAAIGDAAQAQLVGPVTGTLNGSVNGGVAVTPGTVPDLSGPVTQTTDRLDRVEQRTRAQAEAARERVEDRTEQLNDTARDTIEEAEPTIEADGSVEADASIDHPAGHAGGGVEADVSARPDR